MIGAMSGMLSISDFAEAERAVASAMRELAELVDEIGGIVGHIKFVVASQDRWSQISVTDDEDNIRRFDDRSCRLDGVAIVFSLDEEVLRKFMKKTLGKLMA